MKRKRRLAEAMQDNGDIANMPLKTALARAKFSHFLMLALLCASFSIAKENAHHACKNQGGNKLSEITKSESARSDKLLGLTEYYDAVLSSEGLIAKESEFRTNKLSLILDFIRTVSIPENLRTDLISAIIGAWRLQVPEMTLRQREDELNAIISSINSIKYAVRSIKRQEGPMMRSQLDVIVLSDLPLMPSDLLPKDAPVIYDLLGRMREHSQ